MALPFSYNDAGEPYLPLIEPYGSSYRLTLPKMSDIDDLVRLLNDRRVYMGLKGPPYPYTPEDGGHTAPGP